MPIGAPSHSPEPKSGWRPVSAPIEAMTAAELAATGRRSTRSFHGFEAGKTEQPAMRGTDAVAPPSAATAAPTTSSFKRESPVPRVWHEGSVPEAAVHSGHGRVPALRRGEPGAGALLPRVRRAARG